MRTLAFDCRMALHVGHRGVPVQRRTRCMALLADAVRFRLLGYDGAFPVPDGVSWEPVSFDAPIYSITEQYRMLPLLRGCDALWLPHYPIPGAGRASLWW